MQVTPSERSRYDKMHGNNMFKIISGNNIKKRHQQRYCDGNPEAVFTFIATSKCKPFDAESTDCTYAQVTQAESARMCNQRLQVTKLDTKNLRLLKTSLKTSFH
jgi:hypothetical protein